MNKVSKTFQFDFSKHSSLLVGLLSNTHGYLNKDIHRQLSNCDVLLHAGDIGSFQVIKQLKKISKNIIPVCGNNDVKEKWAKEEHQDLNKISDLAEVNFPGGNIVITHGDRFFSVANRHKKMREHFPNAKAIVYGHSHKLVCDLDDKPWVLNPGAAGKTRTKGGASCLIMQITNAQWEVNAFRSTI